MSLFPSAPFRFLQLTQPPLQRLFDFREIAFHLFPAEGAHCLSLDAPVSTALRLTLRDAPGKKVIGFD
jgi:hypothetical protein